MAGQVGRRARGRGCRNILVIGGVEAGHGVLVEVCGPDVGDVGACVEGLVLWAVEVGRISQLDGGVGAGGDGGGRVGDVQACVPWVHFPDRNGVENVSEVGLRFGI